MKPKTNYGASCTWMGCIKFDSPLLFDMEEFNYTKHISEVHYSHMLSEVNEKFQKNLFNIDLINAQMNEFDNAILFSLIYPSQERTERCILDGVNVFLANACELLCEKVNVSTTRDIREHMNSRLKSYVDIDVSHKDIKEILLSMQGVLNPFFEQNPAREYRVGIMAFLKKRYLKSSCWAISWIIQTAD